ncbi:hypothetical protein BX600DRAFT_452102 [Xylariales sp. PMI_506]|nr:hypothetical protein BX600DRAFT_452102 [Xylariales sp. PMI_506]
MPFNTEFAFLLELLTLPPRGIDTTQAGEKTFSPVSGGMFQGPKIKGVVLPGGGNWNTVHSDGTCHLNAMYTICTNDGVMINVVNEGHGRVPPPPLLPPPPLSERAMVGPNSPVRSASPGKKKRFGPDLQGYTKTMPRFDVAPGKYEWLTQSAFVADILPSPRPQMILVEVHKVL